MDNSEMTLVSGNPEGRRDSWVVPNVSWSPDGSKIMYGCGSELCAVNVDDGSLVFDSLPPSLDWIRPGSEIVAAWSPDGSRIAVRVDGEKPYRYQRQDGGPILFTMDKDGTNPHVLETRPPADVAACSDGAVVPDPEENPGLVEDCRVLLGIRDRLSGSATLDWGSDRSIMDWPGVTVNGEPLRVRALINTTSLSYYYFVRLDGQIPPEIGSLTALERLELSGTGLNGRIPPELGNLANLERLDLSVNRLTGSIPLELGTLANLESLDLSNNRLTGSIPLGLGNLANLRELYLAGNELTGCIPSALRVTRNDKDDLGIPYCTANED